jgi:hypothetical protein
MRDTAERENLTEQAPAACCQALSLPYERRSGHTIECILWSPTGTLITNSGVFRP